LECTSSDQAHRGINIKLQYLKSCKALAEQHSDRTNADVGTARSSFYRCESEKYQLSIRRNAKFNELPVRKEDEVFDDTDPALGDDGL